MNAPRVKRTAVILGHYDGRYGRIDILEDYLHLHHYAVIRLLHPFEAYERIPSMLKGIDGKEVHIERKSHGIRNYFEDFFLSVNLLRKEDVKLALATTNFDALPLIFCRKILRKNIEQIIYYPRDYSENRFPKKLLNLAYVSMERTVVKHADITVSNTVRAENKRLMLGLKKHRSIIIPNGVHLSDVTFSRKDISKNSFIYAGDVSRDHGVHNLIESLIPIIKKLVIIGSGDNWDQIINLAKKHNINLEIHHKKSRQFVLDYLQKFEGLGLAPYSQDAPWTYYCSPVKVYEYIASGVPIIIANTPEIAQEVESSGLGITYSDLNLGTIQNKLNKLDVTNFNEKAEDFYKKYELYSLLKRLKIR
jgi:glycosyltransferase involved in cell wall biosynthesis